MKMMAAVMCMPLLMLSLLNSCLAETRPNIVIMMAVISPRSALHHPPHDPHYTTALTHFRHLLLIVVPPSTSASNPHHTG